MSLKEPFESVVTVLEFSLNGSAGSASINLLVSVKEFSHSCLVWPQRGHMFIANEKKRIVRSRGAPSAPATLGSYGAPRPLNFTAINI